MSEPDRMPASELLALRLAAMPAKQLYALRQAAEGSMVYAAALMTWLRDLVLWEIARRRSKSAAPALPKLAGLDVATGVLTLSTFVALFQSTVAGGAIELQPTVDLLDAIREALLACAANDSPRLH